MTEGDEVDTERSVALSALRDVSRTSLSALVAEGVRRVFDPGDVVELDGAARPHVYLTVSGLVRMSVRADDGRTMTVRYCRTGSLIGVASVFAPVFRLPVSIEAVTGSVLLALRPDSVRRHAEADPTLSRALLAESGARIQEYVEEITRSSFASVSERLARHLLDLSTDDGTGTLVVQTSQEELAGAVGSVREVAARALRGLRDQGLVRTERNRVVVLDAERLVELSRAGGRSGNIGHRRGHLEE